MSDIKKESKSSDNTKETEKNKKESKSTFVFNPTVSLPAPDLDFSDGAFKSEAKFPEDNTKTDSNNLQKKSFPQHITPSKSDLTDAKEDLLINPSPVSEDLTQQQENVIQTNINVSTDNKQILAKIPIKKIAVPRSELNNFVSDNNISSKQTNELVQGDVLDKHGKKIVATDEESSSKKNIFQKIKGLFRKKPKKDIKNKAINPYEERVDKVIESVALLFAPFKDILIKTLPFTKGILGFIDKIALCIAWVAKFIALRMPTIIHFIKSSYFKILVVVVIVLFIGGAIISRSINSPTYVRFLEQAVYQHTGHNVTIGGTVKVRFLPSFVVSATRVSIFINDDNALKQNKFNISNLNAETAVIRFKVIPLLLGRFEVKSLSLNHTNIDIKSMESTKTLDKDNIDFDTIINNIKKNLTVKVNASIIEEVKSQEKIKDSSNNNVVEDLRSLLNMSDDSKTTDDSFIEYLGDSTANSLENSGGALNDDQSQDTPIPDEYNQNEYPVDSQPYTSVTETTPKTNQDISIRDSNNQKGLGYLIVSYFIKNLGFSYDSVDSINISRGQINILNENNRRLLVLTNVSSKLDGKSRNAIKGAGAFRFNNTNIDYVINTRFSNNGGYTYNGGLSFGNFSDAVIFKGQKDANTDTVYGNIAVKEEGLALITSNFLFNSKASDFKNTSIVADFQLTSSSLFINDISITSEKQKYTGNILWDFSSNNSFLNIEMSIDTPDITYLLNYYLNNYNKTVVKGSSFLGFVEITDNWKNAYINNFRVTNFRLNLTANNTSLNGEYVPKAKLTFITNTKNQFYLEDLTINSENSMFFANGEIDLAKKNGVIAIEAKGDVSSASGIWNLPQQGKKFLNLVGDGSSEYNLSTKIVLDNSRVVINDIRGFIGNRKIDNTYALYFQRVGSADLIINSKLDSLSGEYLRSLYTKQIDGLSFNENKSVNIFGISNNLSIRLNLTADVFTYDNFKFRNADLEIALINSGVLVNKFTAIGENGGSVLGSFNSDTSVEPIIAGHLNFNDYVFKMEEISNIAFNGKRIVGNVMLNGRVRFSGSSFSKPFEKVDGDIYFIKQERAILNRVTNLSGFYLTVTEEKRSNTVRYLVNDLYGRVNIINSKVEFYPVAVLFISNKVEHRGMLTGSYDFSSNFLQADGSVDNTNNINKQVQFSFNGTLSNPHIVRRNVTLNRNTSSVANQKPQSTVQANSTTHKVANALNNTADPEHFNNTYNFNIRGRDEELKEKSFSRDIAPIDKADVYDFNNLYGNTPVDELKERNRDDFKESKRALDLELNDDLNRERDNFKKNYNPKKQELNLFEDNNK